MIILSYRLFHQDKRQPTQPVIIKATNHWGSVVQRTDTEPPQGGSIAIRWEPRAALLGHEEFTTQKRTREHICNWIWTDVVEEQRAEFREQKRAREGWAAITSQALPHWCPRGHRGACGVGTSRRPAAAPQTAWWWGAGSRPARWAGRAWRAWYLQHSRYTGGLHNRRGWCTKWVTQHRTQLTTVKAVHSWRNTFSF